MEIESRNLFPLRYAYIFMEENNYSGKAEEVRESKDSYDGHKSTLRRAKLLDFFEKEGVLNEFIEQYWPNGKEDIGKKEIKKLKKMLISFHNERDAGANIIDDDTISKNGNNLMNLNQIFYGPPGTGKTYNTINAALQIINNDEYVQNENNRSALKKIFDKYVDDERIGFVTFHQSFSYEDFVEGLKADADDDGNIRYFVQDGIFKQLCKKASETDKEASKTHNAKEPVVLIIDEINRGNTANIFGELITLIEPSKRHGADESLSVVLPYSKDRFSVPNNLFIIGTMNTADRSLALIDTALRRRFQFKEMLPDPVLLKDISIEGVDIQELLTVMNKRIALLYDRDHTLGHSFFMSLNENSIIMDLKEIFDRQILPLLEEYFFEDWKKIRQVLGDQFKQEELQIIKADIDDKDVSRLLGDSNNDMINSLYSRNHRSMSNAETYIAIYKEHNQ